MHSDRYYSADFGRLAVTLVPTFLRKRLLTAIAQTVGSAFGRMAADIRQWRQTRIDDIEATGQTCVMRHRLNTLMDDSERRIRIEDGTAPTQWFARRRGTQVKGECPPSREDMRTQHPQCYRRGEAGGETGFIVRLPQEIYDDEEKRELCRSYVIRHKLAGKTFAIETL